MFKNIVKLGNETERRAEFEKNKAKVCRRGGLYKAAKQLGSEAAKHDLDVKTQRSEEVKRHSLLRLRKFDLFRKIVDILSLVKRNILLSPLEGEKKFLSELCELRNFGEGYKKTKNSDRATEYAIVYVGDKKGKLFHLKE